MKIKKILFLILLNGCIIALSLNAQDNEKPFTIVSKKADAYYKFAMGHFFEINNDLSGEVIRLGL